MTVLPAPQRLIPIATWKVYSDAHLTFRYPSAWNIVVSKTLNGPGKTVLALVDPGLDLSNAQDSPRELIDIDILPDEYHGSITEYIHDPVYRGRTEKGITTIGGQRAYVFQGVNPPVTDDFRVVFAKEFVFNFNSNAGNINAAAGLKRGITDIFESLLETVQFK